MQPQQFFIAHDCFPTFGRREGNAHYNVRKCALFCVKNSRVPESTSLPLVGVVREVIAAETVAHVAERRGAASMGVGTQTDGDMANEHRSKVNCDEQ